MYYYLLFVSHLLHGDGLKHLEDGSYDLTVAHESDCARKVDTKHPCSCTPIVVLERLSTGLLKQTKKCIKKCACSCHETKELGTKVFVTLYPLRRESSGKIGGLLE